MMMRAARQAVAGLAAGLLLCACSPVGAPDETGDSDAAAPVDLSQAAALALSCTGCHSVVGEGIASL
ncbi:MAG: hypothetical protein WA989_00160, partial [Henriciella sp.]|uniref:hypothetical protein n=1 Tax=Henriciella sp. TaxID=1968823 RepID=UPI003C7176F9